MAWNGSDSAGQPANGRANRPAGRGERPARPHKSPSALRGILAGVLVCAALAGVLVYVLSGDKPVPAPREPKNPAAIKEVTPAPAPKTESLKKHTGQKWRPQVVQERTKDVKPPELSQREIELKELNKKFFGEPIFKHDSENMIAGVLSAVPGERFIIDEVDRGFDEDFAKAVNEKIETFPDDPEDVKTQKEAVIAAKETLAKMLAKGESPGSVLSDMIKDLNAVADYRDKLADNVRLVMKKGTEEELRLYVEECNKNLSAYGAIPIEISERQYQRLRDRIARGENNKEDDDE